MGRRITASAADLADRCPPLPAAIAPLRIADGTLEALKWLALVLMTVDHVNKYLFDHKFGAMYILGRVAMPLFVFVLAYNLARPGAMEAGAFARTAKRLSMFGLVACVPYIAFGTMLGGWWPLNILFTLAVATLVLMLVAKGTNRHDTAAVLVFAAGGALVEYWWPALAVAWTGYRYCQRPTWGRLAGVGIALLSLAFVNQNAWALAALPLIAGARFIDLQLPRSPRFFYVYYPAHLAVLWVLAKLLH